jgi:hypothetical protein
MAGYSETPLGKKLGIGEGTAAAIVGPAPEEVCALTSGRRREPLNVLLAFVTEEKKLRSSLEGWAEQIDVDGAVWVCWPKKAARKVISSDITEDTIRDVCLPLGLVDVKVCAVNDVWSGLKLVWRKDLRAARRVPAARDSRTPLKVPAVSRQKATGPQPG